MRLITKSPVLNRKRIAKSIEYDRICVRFIAPWRMSTPYVKGKIYERGFK